MLTVFNEVGFFELLFFRVEITIEDQQHYFISQQTIILVNLCVDIVLELLQYQILLICDVVDPGIVRSLDLLTFDIPHLWIDLDSC